MEKKEFMRLETQNERLYLDGIKLRGVEQFEIKKSSANLRGKAELSIKLIVDYPDNMQEIQSNFEKEENYLPLSKSHTAE